MPGFNPSEAQACDAWLTTEPDEGREFICPKQCENPEKHTHLPYCPEKVATELVGMMSEAPQWPGLDEDELWDEICECCEEGDSQGYGLSDVDSYAGAEYLLALRMKG